MAKEDAPAPKHVPTKRRLLERAPDLWLAVWANDAELPEKERERAQSERERRKAVKPDRILGVLVDQEDVTPVQRQGLISTFDKIHPTEIHHPWTTRRIASACRGTGVPITTHRTLREVVMASQMVVVAPRRPEDTHNRTPAWEAVRHAKNRGLPVMVVLPDGTERH